MERKFYGDGVNLSLHESRAWEFAFNNSFSGNLNDELKKIIPCIKRSPLGRFD